ncbi:hypothetical protein J5N97_025826 [Dioscorea zingiberensis]|uniref:Uncharacterized protein n=1 Tax=Dioscorea zingiberensis TaxID=325984 RepID=A0A9D5C1Y2_9LILI|nr:hypothetical protein J5N97_025826 [Dioscorea zingiberensis]
MGIPWEMRNSLTSTRGVSLIAASPDEQRVLASKNSIQEAVKEGFKNASIAGAAAAVPTPLIAAFFVTADKTILGRARGELHGQE